MIVIDCKIAHSEVACLIIWLHWGHFSKYLKELEFLILLVDPVDLVDLVGLVDLVDLVSVGIQVHRHNVLSFHCQSKHERGNFQNSKAPQRNDIEDV